jgi:adenylate cyclase
MFTDLAGFTTLGQRDEAGALELANEYRRLLRDAVQRHGGREIKSLGDGSLVEFPNALDAVQCALGAQRAIHERNASKGAGATLDMRVGVHLGDVVESEGDIAGDAVNIASRLEPLAAPGEICISQQVYDQVYNKLDVPIGPGGEVRLKHVERPMTVYRLTPGRGSSVRPPPASTAGDRLAVLPFVNISPDGKDEYFADGMTEELIGRLSTIQGLKVIARTSVMPFKRREMRLAQIGQELGVASILEGSVRRAGDQIRVSVQLVDARTEEHLWSANYDKQLTDVFAVQSDVASNVARSLSREVFRGRRTGETQRIEAYTAYLRGTRLLNEANPSHLPEAIRFLEEAIALDPEFGRAHAALAQALGSAAMQGTTDWSDVVKTAEPHARLGVELAPDAAEAHAAFARVLLLQDRFREALPEVAEAIRLNPSLADGFSTLALLKAAFGAFDEALAALRRAYEFDPLSIAGAVTYAWTLQLNGHASEALEVLERIARTYPSEPDVVDGFAEYHLLRQEWNEAAALLDKGLNEHPNDLQLRADRARLRAMTGRADLAEDDLEFIHRSRNRAAYNQAVLYVAAAMGDRTRAFEALMALADEHAWPTVLFLHPIFEGLRGDPRFGEFRHRVGLD